MSIHVKFFASLQQQLKMQETVIDARPGLLASDVWQAATNDASMPANTLCAINLEHASLQTEIRDGDEVAFFPPVTGG